LKADVRRDILRKTILKLLSKGTVRYTALEKRVCSSGYPFATTNTFKPQLHYLLCNGYIMRIARGVYQITLEGEKLYAVLPDQPTPLKVGIHTRNPRTARGLGYSRLAGKNKRRC